MIIAGRETKLFARTEVRAAFVLYIQAVCYLYILSQRTYHNARDNSCTGRARDRKLANAEQDLPIEGQIPSRKEWGKQARTKTE